MCMRVVPLFFLALLVVGCGKKDDEASAASSPAADLAMGDGNAPRPLPRRPWSLQRAAGLSVALLVD